MTRPAPLAGIRVLDLTRLLPGPMCTQHLADFGAAVIKIEDIGAGDYARTLGPMRGDTPVLFELVNRNKRGIRLDLKNPEGLAVLLRLAKDADILVEGFRPGVMDKLGAGYAALSTVNPRIVYCSITGYGQDGPYAQRAGHDINYIALSGVLNALGRRDETPVPPINLLGDFGGGGALFAFGMVCALLEAGKSGRGQVVDAAMTEGASLLAAMVHGMRASGTWSDRRGTNLLDTGAPWYDVYRTLDGRHVAIGAIEPQFYQQLLERLGLAGEALPDQNDRAGWPALRARFTEVFLTRTRDDWTRVFDGVDACYAPVLAFSEAPDHPHNAARAAFLMQQGAPVPAPAPRLSRTPPLRDTRPPAVGEGGSQAMAEWGAAPCSGEA